MPANDGGPVFELARNSYAGTTTEKKEPACSAWRALHPIIKVAFSRMYDVRDFPSKEGGGKKKKKKKEKRVVRMESIPIRSEIKANLMTTLCPIQGRWTYRECGKPFETWLYTW
uniref:Uncharacterized protein n=1 Tax=Vespula pensylvanica TaxID=30213 RepID=A0A834UC86_VESPE|nr:hypothetical protein H0235_006102 [Vespula pensylvanica]